MQKVGNKAMWALRITLFVAGSALGYFIMHSVVRAYPTPALFRYRYVYCAGTGVLLGVVLLLSAGSVLQLAFAVGSGVKTLFRDFKPLDAVAVLIGLAVGGLLTYLLEFLLSLGLKILALRVIIDVVFCLFAVGLAIAGARKALYALPHEEADAPPPIRPDKGYILTASALSCEEISSFCRDWLTGKICVSDASVAALIACGAAGEEGLRAYRELLKAGAVTVPAGQGDETAAVAEYARANGLRVIAAQASEFEGAGTAALGYKELRGGEKPAEQTGQPLESD